MIRICEFQRKIFKKGNGATNYRSMALAKYALEGRLRGFDFGGMTKPAVANGCEVRKRIKDSRSAFQPGSAWRELIPTGG